MPITVKAWLIALAGVVLALVAIFGFADSASAVPALPTPYVDHQPNGSTFSARQFGDEWYNGVETEAGYTLLKNAAGEWTYATPAAGDALVAGPAVVGEDPVPPSLAPHLRDAGQLGNRKDALRSAPAPAPSPVQKDGSASGTPPAGELPSATPSTGEDPVLVILAQFTDQTNLGTTAANWNAKYFGQGKSARDYYEEVSYGKFGLTAAAETSGTAGDGVVGWLTLPMVHPNTPKTVAANQEVVRQAVIAADPYVNYASYDTDLDGVIEPTELHISVIVAGYEYSVGVPAGGKGVWGHRWGIAPSLVPTLDGTRVGSTYTEFGEIQGNHQATIGIIVHELGHDLDLPDLYDVAVDDQPAQSYGIGAWSVMSYGTWQNLAGEFAGDTPLHPDAWSKYTKGWIVPTRIVGTSTATVKAAASVSNSQVAVQLLDNPGGADWQWPGLSNATGEYFLVENRQRLAGTYDAGLPGEGMLIYHINEAQGDNSNDALRLVDVEEADGLRNLDTKTNTGDAGDPFPGSSGNRAFTATSNPNSTLANGTASGVSVTGISNSGASMSATFTTPGGGPPPNDAFEAATTITSRSFSATSSISEASIQTGEIAQASCPLGRTVWFRYSPPTNVLLTASTQGSDLDTVLNVWQGTTFAGLAAQGCNDDHDNAAGEHWSAVPEFVAQAGKTYYFQAGGYYDQAAQTVETGSLNFTLTARSINDDYRNAQVITGASGSVLGDNTNATAEAGEPLHAGTEGPASVWFRWTPSVSGTTTIDTLGSAVGDTLLAVYSGTTISGTEVASNDDIAAGTNSLSRVTIVAQAGTTYSIAVAGWGTTKTAQGALKLNWSLSERPSAPRTVTAAAGNGRASVTWLAPLTPGTGTGLTYTVTAYRSSPDEVSTHSCTTVTVSCTVTGLFNLPPTATPYTFKVVATTSKGSSPASAASNPVWPQLPALTTQLPTISGTRAVAAKLTALPGAWSPTPITFAYQWYRDSAAISGATGVSYTVVTTDAGASISVKVTGTKTGYSSTSRTSAAVVIARYFTSKPTVAITGTVKVLSTVTATLSGAWSPTATQTYQWYQDSLPISGATAATYLLPTASAGHSIYVRLQATRAGYTTAAVKSVAIVVPKLLTAGQVVITGTRTVGSTLTSHAGTWAPAPVTTTFQWYRNGAAIAGASAQTYKVVAADKGTRITVVATGAKSGYSTLKATSPAVLIT